MLTLIYAIAWLAAAIAIPIVTLKRQLGEGHSTLRFFGIGFAIGLMTFAALMLAVTAFEGLLGIEPVLDGASIAVVIIVASLAFAGIATAIYKRKRSNAADRR